MKTAHRGQSPVCGPTGTPGTALGTVIYGHNDSWGDMLTSYGGFTVTSDAIGNILSDGKRAYTWEHGRQLKTSTQNQTTWYYFYNADGRRTWRWGGNTGYNYAYNGGRLTDLLVSNNFMHFIYDATGPLGVIWNGITYFYLRNLQGDITAILNGSGAAVVTYSYDAWGKILSIGGSLASTLGVQNPFRYRGYVYDQETGLYYLQTRYYDPELGRFISADSYASTGQGFAGCNMFAYCLNNPVVLVDTTGRGAEMAAEWEATWAWMCMADGLAPIGDAIFGLGYLIALWSTDEPVIVANVEPVSPDKQNSDAQESNVSDYGSTTASPPGPNRPHNERKTNVNKNNSPQWHSFDNVKNSGLKTSGRGSSRRFYDWDYTHNDIEVYNHRGEHLGSMDPVTGQIYKPPIPGRVIKIP